MHEDLLRHIWSKQLFDPSRLVTTDGRAVRILNAGTLHRGSGPDFRNASIEIGGTTFFGDVEFHRTFDDWNLHNHHNDPNYNSVILHVVLRGNAAKTPSQSGRKIPTIVLEPYLQSPIETIEDHLSREEFSSKKNSIKCADHNEKIEVSLMNEWIRVLYRERLQEKILRLHERLCDIIVSQQRVIGESHSPYNEMLDDIPIPDAKIDKELFKQKIAWEQLLHEEVMDGLGYSNNRVPMKKLAGNVSLIQILSIRHNDILELTSNQIEAILFKASGLLPALDDIKDQDSKVYVHSLQSAWNELPQKIPLSPLDTTEWNFSPTRPSNFPTIRIAAASIFLQKLLYHSLFKSIIVLVGGKFSSPQSKIEQLIKIFAMDDHSFWNYHYSFTEATHKKHSLLGESRINDILVNTIVPFVCLYSKVFGKEDLFEHCLNIAIQLPLLEDNSILRTMNKQLIKGKLKIEHAFQQQGLIQMNKRYCVVERCIECEVGKKVF